MKSHALLPIAATLAGALAFTMIARADDPTEFKPSTAPSGSASGSASTAPTGDEPPSKPDPYAEPDPAKPPPPPKKKPATLLKPEENPLLVPEGMKEQIGSSYTSEDRPAGNRVRSGLFPLLYKERIGNEITTAAFPFYYDRRLLDDKQNKIEQESFYTLYYRKRSARFDVDAAFPIFFRWRDDQTTTTIVPPVLWRSGPQGEWHRWLAPLVFASSQPDGGYFHAPLLLTFSHHNPKSAFSLIGGIGFYDRTEKDVDWGVVPFVFGGRNPDKLTSYTLIPPLLTYFSSNKDLGTQTTWIGPVLYKSTPTSTIFDVFPLFLHNHGEDYSATTFLPLFHTSRKKDKSLIVTPLFVHSGDKEGRLLITPLYSQYRGRTTLDLAGPIIPIFAHYVDKDVYRESWLLGPVWTSNDPTGYSLITPLFAHFREYGVSRKTWVFPTIVHSTGVDDWSFDVYPLLFFGKNEATLSSHSVVAPLWWDFSGPKKRTTVAFPLFWRFRDEEGITQIALNTLYQERTSSKGANWDFYFLPIAHVGDSPQGGSWDFLFGLVGYKRVNDYKQLKLFWIPIDLTKNPDAAKPAPKK